MPENISDELIIWIVNKGINSLGENSGKLLWSILEKDYGFEKSKIPEKLPALMEILQKIFGLSYNFLDLLFKTLLQQSTGKNIEQYGNFAQCVTELRKEAALSLQVQKNEIPLTESFQSTETSAKEITR